MELMTEKHKHCVNPRHSCHMKAEGLNFNPRKSWKNTSCPVVLTHVMDQEEPWPVGTRGEGGGGVQQRRAGMKYWPFWMHSADLQENESLQMSTQLSKSETDVCYCRLDCPSKLPQSIITK